MQQQELYEVIGLPEEMVAGLCRVAPEMEKRMPELDSDLNKLMDRATMEKANGNLITILGEDEGNFKMLYCHLECACRIHEKYVQTGIPEQIFVDTMGCFTRFAKECNVRNGGFYFDRGFWTCRQISMSLFRIGTLEYEF
ncbi:MAG: acyltransferase domain-containing protein, partial [Acetatifactor sp.]|nr:acyltransferase domain-containing protein [Acetatifactor sp.]